MNYSKYPRTPYLSWSPSKSKDCLTLDKSAFAGKEVVVTEKMDGENTSMYNDYLHARSVDGRSHPSRDWIKQVHALIKRHIPIGDKLVGENMYAKHSIKYDSLESYFYIFGCMDQHGNHMSWRYVKNMADTIGAPTVPVLYRGPFENMPEIIIDTEKSEGYIIRNAAGFSADEFTKNIAKWVRPDHVQTDGHWMHKAIEKNGLANE